MDPRLLQLLQMHQMGQLPGLGQPGMPTPGEMPTPLASDPQQQVDPRKRGMFGGMAPMFGMLGMMADHSGFAPMFGLAGLGLQKLGLFK